MTHDRISYSFCDIFCTPQIPQYERKNLPKFQGLVPISKNIMFMGPQLVLFFNILVKTSPSPDGNFLLNFVIFKNKLLKFSKSLVKLRKDFAPSSSWRPLSSDNVLKYTKF